MKGSEPSLPTILSYSAQEISLAQSTFPAISRYLNIVSEDHIDNFESKIRIQRHQYWIQCALSIALNKVTPKEVCYFWSQCALEIIQNCWSHHGLLEENNLTLFALGKLGAGELNMSSDVDLMVIGHPKNPEAALKKVKHFKESLSKITELGFVLRVDFDLRPDGNWGPLIVSVPQFQDHYWSRGETWERLALVRLNYVTGNKSIRDEIYDLKSRFSFRKFLDFTLMDDLKSLRNRIHQKAFHTNVKEYDLKLGVGGIRDIELFIHSLLVIHGGRHPSVRSVQTDTAALRLSQIVIDQSENLQKLSEHYWALRDLENRAQIFGDEQTHFIDEKRFDQMLPPISWMTFCKLKDDVDARVSSLLGEIKELKFHLPSSTERQEEWLLKIGHSNHDIENVWPKILETSSLSHKKDRDEDFRKEFLFRFLEEVTPLALDKSFSLGLFQDFIRSTRAKSTLYNLILRNEKLFNILVTLFAKAPTMAHIFISRPELLDSILYGTIEDSHDLAENLETLFEKKQISEIRSALKFLNYPDPKTLGAQLTSTADTICNNLSNVVFNEFQNSNFSICCLGKWGSKGLGFRSDLDFVFVKDGDLNEFDQKAAKKFISYLSSPQKGGKIYDVDLRLRPSGSSGPLLVTKKSLFNYLKLNSAPWERQSYLKFRSLNDEINMDPSILFFRELVKKDFIELRRIRSKLFEKVPPGRIDLKHSPGGLIDIEFSIQIACLSRKIYVPNGSTYDLLEELSAQSPQWSDAKPSLSKSYSFIRRLEQTLRLTSNSNNCDINIEKSEFRNTAQLMGAAPETLFYQLTNILDETHAELKKLDPSYDQD